MYCIEVSSAPTSLFAQASEWDALAGGLPFRETSWLASWWECFGKTREAYLVSARRADGTLAALLPLYRRDQRGVRTLASMADGVVCSDYVSLLVAPEEDPLPLATIIGRWLAAAASAHETGWDSLQIDGVQEGDPVIAAFARGLREAGASLHASSRMHLWRLPIAGRSWDDYLHSMGRRNRTKTRRRSNAVERTEGLELQRIEDAAQVPAALDAIIALHQKRWNLADKPGTFSQPAMRTFIHRAAERFLQRGVLCLPLLTYRGQAIGGEIQLRGKDGVLYCYAAGMDPDFDHLEPGRIVHAETIKYAHQQQLQAVDMMRGDEAYKARLKCQPSALLHLRIAPPRVLPRLQHAAWRTGFEAKQWMRRQAGRPMLTTFDLTAPVVPHQLPDASPIC
jgi:CelD/BcsL family acetyltransferase involved in cellulose biosynthesis